MPLDRYGYALCGCYWLPKPRLLEPSGIEYQVIIAKYRAEFSATFL